MSESNEKSELILQRLQTATFATVSTHRDGSISSRYMLFANDAPMERFYLLTDRGTWLAYQSNESGRDEVYIRPYPETERARVQASTEGGLAPRWARDGSELFFLSGDREMMAATITVTGGELRVSNREVLFDLPSSTLVGDRTTQYDVSNDGRFLMLRTASGDEDESRMVIVRNFLEEVKARVGGGS